MKVITDDIWLCPDCMLFAVNGDMPPDTGIARDMEIEEGVDRLGPNLVPDFGDQPKKLECRDYPDCEWSGPEDEVVKGVCPGCGQDTEGFRDVTRDNGEEEFSRRECDACGTHLAGARYRFAILGEDDADRG